MKLSSYALCGQYSCVYGVLSVMNPLCSSDSLNWWSFRLGCVAVVEPACGPRML